MAYDCYAAVTYNCSRQPFHTTGAANGPECLNGTEKCIDACDAGQGMNQALEDAVELAQAIKQGGFNPSSLRSFESSRIPRLQEIMAAEMVSHVQCHTQCHIH